MKNIICLAVILMVAVACASSNSATKLTEKGKKVQIVDEKPSGCEVAGKVVGRNDFGSVDVARNDARNQAGEMDADYLLIKDEVMNGKSWEVHALAIDCE